MGGPVSTWLEGNQREKGAEEAARLAKEQQVAGMQLINGLDYDPMYASQNVPTYQRSRSPVARSYLESFLAGNNPQATFSGAPNAKVTKMRQQGAQDQMFGTMQQRIAAQRAMEAETPWKVTTPTRKISPEKEGAEGNTTWTVQNSDKAGAGITRSLDEALLQTGTNLEDIKNNRVKGAPYSVYLDRISGLLANTYGGDADRMAADIRAAGGLDNLGRRGR